MHGRSFGSGISPVSGPAVLAVLLVAVVLLGAGCLAYVYGEPSGSDPASAETTATLPRTDGSDIAGGQALGDTDTTGAESPEDVEAKVLQADVFIWDTTSAGIGAVRAMQHAREQYPVGSIVIAAPGGIIAAMPAQGLSVEDTYVEWGDTHTSGFWEEFRADVLEFYSSVGVSGLNHQGRLVVEPEVAERFLRGYLAATPSDQPEVRFLSGHLREVKVTEDGYVLELAAGDDGQGATTTVKASLAIDASVEGDLARLAGARYRFGMSENIYGGGEGYPPLPDGDVPDTWIQRVSALLTLGLSGKPQEHVSAAELAPYLASYPDELRIGAEWAEAFEDSWTMQHKLPGNKRELNEMWSDYLEDIGLPHRYIFGYDKDVGIRQELREEVLTYTVQQVKFLQEHGYPDLEITHLPERLYIREGIRVVGLTTYTGEDVEEGVVYHPVALGKYSQYDVHLPVQNDHSPREISVPMETLISRDLPSLLIPGPLSTDHRAYNSAVRMEPVRANVGGACGVLAAIALAEGKKPAAVPYSRVKEELLRQEYRLSK